MPEISRFLGIVIAIYYEVKPCILSRPSSTCRATSSSWSSTTGVTKRVDLGKHLDGEVFDSLKDLDYFKTVRVSADLGTIVWANDADFAPEFLYEIGVAVVGPARAGRLGVRRGRKRGGRTGAATKGTGKA